MAQYQHPVNVGACMHGKVVEYCQVVLTPTHHLQPRLVDEPDSLSSDVHQMISEQEYLWLVINVSCYSFFTVYTIYYS